MQFSHIFGVVEWKLNCLEISDDCEFQFKQVFVKTTHHLRISFLATQISRENWMVGNRFHSWAVPVSFHEGLSYRYNRFRKIVVES